jgi:hypothetical protein
LCKKKKKNIQTKSALRASPPGRPIAAPIAFWVPATKMGSHRLALKRVGAFWSLIYAPTTLYRLFRLQRARIGCVGASRHARNRTWAPPGSERRRCVALKTTREGWSSVSMVSYAETKAATGMAGPTRHPHRSPTRLQCMAAALKTTPPDVVVFSPATTLLSSPPPTLSSPRHRRRSPLQNNAAAVGDHVLDARLERPDDAATTTTTRRRVELRLR